MKPLGIGIGIGITLVKKLLSVLLKHVAFCQ